MRLYMFKSPINGLCAFSADADGDRLPPQFKPWTADGVVEHTQAPPHNFSRIKIESALRLFGFQLWRLKEKAE